MNVSITEHTWFIIAIILYMLLMLAIGYWSYRQTDRYDEYMLAGRSLGPVVAALSAGAADMSGWLLMGLPGARLNKKTCQLDGGSSVDPYSGDHITSRSALELDHVIPLSAAWDLGAFAWSEQKRIAFANDPLNLVIVSKQQNQAKSDHLPNEWLPPNRWARCWYARRVSAVASSYGLPLPEADKNTLKKQCIIRDFLQMSLE